MTGHKNKAANAAAAKRQQAISSYVKKITKKDTAKIEAKNVIYAHLSKWVGKDLTDGDKVPILHNGRQIGTLNATVLGGFNELQSILEASDELKTPELKSQLADLKSLKSDAEALRDTLSKFDPMILTRATNAAKNMHKDLDGRIVNALGAENAVLLGLDIISVGLVQEIALAEIELKARGPNARGRAKDQAAHRVAIEASNLLVKVTGEMPTYGESADGLTGKFTPFLRDLYDAFGWKDRSLRAGIEAAIKSPKPTQTTSAPIGLLGSYLSDRKG